MAKILLGISGSVAAIKTPELADGLQHQVHEIKVVSTKAAQYFVTKGEFDCDFLTDAEEWPSDGYHRGDNVLHIELRRWADLFVIAPLDANTLAKLATGICDNCLTCVWRAWDLNKPVLLAPAMNTLMWEHPYTARHFKELETFSNVQVIPPISKELACGDIGVGAMASVESIIIRVNATLAERS
jgi:phosphopantothenoylcysteine decarboxylase